jgi:hypothetical protein
MSKARKEVTEVKPALIKAVGTRAKTRTAAIKHPTPAKRAYKKKKVSMTASPQKKTPSKRLHQMSTRSSHSI